MSRWHSNGWTLSAGFLIAFFSWELIKMWGYILTTAVLFFLLTPGVLVSLPPGGTKLTVAATHAIVFALVHKYLQHGGIPRLF